MPSLKQSKMVAKMTIVPFWLEHMNDNQKGASSNPFLDNKSFYVV